MNTLFAIARQRSGRLLQALEVYEQILVVMHDNPDPDAIATGWSVLALVEDKLGIPVRLVAGGAIVRAENRHMVELLRPPVELLDELTVAEHTATVLVDCSPNTTNQLLTRAAVRPVAVLDHHQHSGSPRLAGLAFRDVRPKLVASATIAASYLREQGVDPGIKLATCILYALRTESKGSVTVYSRLDRSMLAWVTAQADPSVLAEIENAPLSRAYFGDLVLAIQSTLLYDGTAFCLLPRAEGAEIVGEVADLLIRGTGIRRVFCGAAVGDDLLISVRTARDAEDATRLLLETIGELGGAGGHSRRAGGKIAGAAREGRIPEALEDELRGRWLGACRIGRQRGTRLVARREIVDNL